MDRIPPLAWAAIIVVVLLTIMIYFVLFAILRGGSGQMKDLGRRLQSRPPNPTVRTLQNMQKVIRDPFQDERVQLDELSKLVSKINESPSNQDPERPPEGQDPSKNP